VNTEFIASDHTKLRYNQLVYPLKTNQVITGLVTSRISGDVYTSDHVFHAISAYIMFAITGPSAYNDVRFRVKVYTNHENVEFVATLPDHKVTCNQLSSSLAVNVKVTTQLTLRYHVADQLESKVIQVNVGVSLSIVNGQVS